MPNHKILWAASVALTGALWGELKRLGCEVVLAEPSRDALTGIEETSPRLWVGEIGGEDEAGFRKLADIRSRFPRLPLLVLSKNPTLEQAVKAMKMGVVDYVQSDISPEHLSAILEGILDDSSVTRKTARPLEKISESGTRPIAAAPSMKGILETAVKVAPKRTTILLQGESGTGKEVLARYIHRTSDRCGGPFVAVNCAALPENLLESELFGHEKGAFTGASSRKPGKFELADGGTLLLDEISEMPFSLQAKLLRVLQEREVDRVGGQSAVPVDVRVIATTNRNLEEETKKGNFRLDLYYRLNVIPLMIPPLRERREDIIPLCDHFLEKHGELNGERPKRISAEAGEVLKGMDWPGNVRELENLMERATLLVESDTIRPDNLVDMGLPGRSHAIRDEQPPLLSLKEMEKKMIVQALQGEAGNRTHAARVLGISVRTLRNKLHEYRKELEQEGVLSAG